MTEDTTTWDYVIVGAGSAGCVLAERLSVNRAVRVLLVEAGPRDTNPFIHIPKGFVRTLRDPRLSWFFPVEPSREGGNAEVWPRGKALGGSSAVNGMMYVRGQPQDYEDWKAQGNIGWGWSEMLSAFRAIENHTLGASELRGGGGPLFISARPPERLEAWEALIEAGEELGLSRKEDLNQDAGAGIGYLPATIRKGRRVSAASAFLAPARSRRNLKVLTGVTVQRLASEGQRITGVVATDANGREMILSGQETILCAGAIGSPKLLQLSGIGPGERLSALGIPVVADSLGVGENLLEHRLLGFQFRIKRGGYNAGLRGPGLAFSILRYLALRQGPIATGAYQVGAFIRSLPESDRPDSELLMGAYSIDPQRGGMTLEREPGLRIISFAMRPRSHGHVRIMSADPSAPLSICANYLSDPYDQAVSVASARFIRNMARQPALASLIVAETAPGLAVETDEAIVDEYVRKGTAGMHATSTCRMGTDQRSVVDPQLRVRGVTGLRIIDCSVMPSMVSGNTNGPVMAMAWNAARIILEGRR